MHWLCLSSDREDLYVQDIRRATAAPPGGILRFRYEEELVSRAALDRIETKQYEGDLATICYVHKPETGTPSICPVRRARMAGAWREGRMVIIEFILTDFIKIKDIASYTARLLERFANLSVVSRDRSNTVRPYCLTEDRPPLGEVVSTAADAWEATVVRLSEFEAFSTAGYFFRVSGPVNAGRKDLGTLEDGTWQLTAGRAYSVELTHWHPVETGRVEDLTLRCTTESVELDRTQIRLRTRYNSQVVRIRAQQTLDRSDGVLTINQVVGPRNDEVSFLELPLTVIPRRGRLFIIGLIFSLLVSAPNMLEATGWQEVIVIGVFSVLGAVVIAFGLRRLPSI